MIYVLLSEFIEMPCTCRSSKPSMSNTYCVHC